MCSPAALLVGSTALSAYSTYQEGKAQQEAYKQQAEAYQEQAAAAEQNAKITAKQGEIEADNYAKKQKALNDRLKLARGQRAAAMGAAGLSGVGGTASDLMSSEMDAYNEDSANLLASQRNDMWSNYINQVNYRKSAANSIKSANNALKAADNAKKQTSLAIMGTLLGGASTAYSQNMIGGQKKKSITVGG